MYFKTIFINVFFSHIFFYSYSQTNFFSGRIKDKETQENLPYVIIHVLNSKTVTHTNQDGTFKLNLNDSAGSYNIKVTYIGYETDTFQIINSQKENIFYLKTKVNQLNEVVITGVSKATFVKENPISVVSISAKAIENSTENNIIDALVKNAPGVNAVKTGPNISKPFIRGLGYNRVLTLYDGVRQEGQQWGDEHGIEVDAYNIEKAEIIKGPASLMFGSDALAGVVSLIPVLPKNTNGKITGKYITEYQTNNGLIGNGFRIAYGKEKWAYNLKGSYRMAQNYRNSIDGRVYNTNFNEINFSNSVSYSTNKGFSNLNFTLFDNLQGIPDGSRDSLSRSFTKQIAEGELDDVKTRPIVSSKELNLYKFSPLHQHIQHYRLYSNNHYKLGKGDLDVMWALQQNLRREYNHPTIPSQAGMYVRLNTLNYGFKYNFSFIKNTESTIGFNGMYQNNKNKDATDFPIPNYSLFDAGGFIFTKWKYVRWTISGGLRLDHRLLNTYDLFKSIDPNTGFEKESNSSNAIEQQFIAFSKKFNGVSYSLGSTYKLSEQISLKGNIAKGYRAPSITELASNGLDPGAHIVYLGNKSFIPEFSFQEDLGIFLDNKQISTALSLFNNHIKNYIYLSQLTDNNGNSILDAQGNKTYQYKQSKAQLYGFEFQIAYKPLFIKNFTISNSTSTVYGFNRKEEYKNQGTEGEFLPFIPPLKIVNIISQDIHLVWKKLQKITLNIEHIYNAAQNRYLALNNTETVTSAYQLWSFSINSELNYKNKPSIQFQINNIFNTSYQSNLSRLKYFEYYNYSTKGNLGIYGMGRNICIKTIIPF